MSLQIEVLKRTTGMDYSFEPGRVQPWSWRQMLRGYRADNTRVDGSQAHKAYSADPASRYRGFKDKVLGTWAAGVPARQATDAPDVRRGR